MPVVYPNLHKFRRIVNDMVTEQKVTLQQVKKVLIDYCGADFPRTQFVKFNDRNAVLGELMVLADVNLRMNSHVPKKVSTMPHAYIEWDNDGTPKRVYNTDTGKWYDFKTKKFEAIEEGEDVLVSGKKDELPEGYELFRVGNHITTAQWVEFAADTKKSLLRLSTEVEGLRAQLADLKPLAEMVKNLKAQQYVGGINVKRMDV